MEPNPNETEKRMQAVVAAVSSGVKLGTAARNFNVPRTTLRNRLTGRPARRGPATVLTVEEEETLEKWIIDCSRKGFPRRKEDLFVSVKEYFDKDATRQNPFTNNLPGTFFTPLPPRCYFFICFYFSLEVCDPAA